MSNNNPAERRQFTRIPFKANAHITSKKAEIHLNCDVIDISLKGILIAKPSNWLGHLYAKYQVNLLLENGQLIIQMQSSVAHIDDDTVGFICEQIDIDSISHLKRLVELNLGDDSLLYRELHALIH